jgi:hypothetical protein
MASGYAKALQGVGRFLFLVLLAALASIIIVLPLWYSAIHARRAYTITVFCLLAALIVLGIVAKTRSLVKESGSLFRQHLIRFLRKLMLLLLSLAFLYGILWFFARGRYYFAFPLLITYLLLMGFIKYGKNRGRAA